MVILQIVKTSEGAVWAFRQALELKKIGYTVYTVCPDTIGRTAQMYIENGLRVIEADTSLPIKNPWMFFSRAQSIKRIVEEIRPDIIHTHFVTNTIMLRLALRKDKTPRVFQVPGPLHLESKLPRFIEIKLSRNNDYWIGACKKTCELYKAFGVASDHVFLGYYGGYGGMTCDRYERKSGILHQEYNIPDSTKIVSMISYYYKPKRYVGQTRGIKGHEDFIDAMEVVCQKRNNVIGMIIGGAWDNSAKYEKQIQKYAEMHLPHKIIFTGTRRDLYKVYKEIDIAVHPSHSENLGGAAESLAAGVPTISTTVGGFPDIVIDGETGFTVPPKDPSELSNAILKMLDNEEDAMRMAKNGQALVRRKLDIDTCVQNIDIIYRKLLCKKERMRTSG